MFGGRYPDEIDQDFITGENDLLFAKSATFAMFLDRERNPEIDDDWYDLWEAEFTLAVRNFNEQAKTFKVVIFNAAGVSDAFTADIRSDLLLI